MRPIPLIRNTTWDTHPGGVAWSHRPSVAAVYAGGGHFGIAYMMGVLEGLRTQGIELAGVPSLGTSAGSWVAAATNMGVAWEEFTQVQPTTHDMLLPGYLSRYARYLFGTQTTPNVTTVACNLLGLRRTLLDAATLPVAECIAASSAVPGMFLPHRVGKALYLDGGVRSMSSIDLAGPADTLYVLAPIAGAVLPPCGTIEGTRLLRLVKQWESRTGGRAVVITPTDGVAAMGRSPLAIFDASKRHAVYLAAKGSITPSVRALPLPSLPYPLDRPPASELARAV